MRNGGKMVVARLVVVERILVVLWAVGDGSSGRGNKLRAKCL